MEEIWKEVPLYKGILSVSNTGKVKRLNYKNSGKDRDLSIQVKKNQVCCISVLIDGRCRTLSVHRLVAITFLPNPNNYPCVNHKDENRLNNNVDNLEWCSYEYNNNYMTRNRRISESKINGKKSKAVLQFDKEGNLIKEWPSTREVERQLGFKQNGIAACARGKAHYNTAYGFIWKYKADIQ